MIGDPKQAIYGFRGADVFSYLKAAQDVRKKYTLTHNWRSAPKLITAVNTLFSSTQKPFVFEDIPYETASPGNDRLQADAEEKLLQSAGPSYVKLVGSLPQIARDSIPRIMITIASWKYHHAEFHGGDFSLAEHRWIWDRFLAACAV